MLIVRYWMKRPRWKFWRKGTWVEKTLEAGSPSEALLICEAIRMSRQSAGARMEYNGEIVAVTPSGKMYRVFS